MANSSSYAKKLLIQARIQGWLNANAKTQFDKIVASAKNETPSEIIDQITSKKILTESQVAHLHAILEDKNWDDQKQEATPSLFFIQKICKTYKTPESHFLALKDINLNIYQGEILGILGFSGSGKSTLLNILGLLSTPDPVGDIFFQGTRYKDLSNKQRDILRNKNFGFIFQESHLLAHLSTIENVALPLRLQNYSDAECYEKSKNILLNFMTTGEKEQGKMFFNKKPSQLSGGQKQRVAAARAIVHKPQVIFADEPTGNLDFDTAIMVMNVLLKAAKEHDTTVILVTHNPSQARQYCDRFVWMENGHLKNHLATGMANTMMLVKQLSGKELR